MRRAHGFHIEPMQPELERDVHNQSIVNAGECDIIIG